jgi:hypothetical protein
MGWFATQVYYDTVVVAMLACQLASTLPYRGINGPINGSSIASIGLRAQRSILTAVKC